ncbi:MAG TPA: GAF domain-containing protein [Acidimicrobiales bacterium]|nr:GAF domain-containing protein [Acidimicrobiales bacterium]
MRGHAGPEALRRLVEATVNIGADLDLRSVLHRVLVAAVDLADARYGALAVLDRDGRGFADLITIGLPDELVASLGANPQGLGLLGHVMETKDAVRVPVVSEHPKSVGVPSGHPTMRSFLGVPIRVRDQVYGNLYLTNKQSGELFTEVDEELVVALASAAGVAIEHARLFETVAHRERVIAAFNNISSALLRGLPRDDVLQMVAVSARSLVGGALASIVVPDVDGTVYVPAAAGKFSEAYRGRHIPSGVIAKRVMRTRTAGTFDNLSADPEAGHLMDGLGPALYVPINVEGPDGCLVVIGIVGDPPFDDADRELLGKLASQARLVFEHDRRRQREAELVRAEDQFRIAESLQDSALQEIFAASLRLSGAAVIAETKEVQGRISEAIEGLDRAITLTRQAIFDLKPKS